MARYYGSAQGERGETHRLGHKRMTTICATWDGAIEVQMWKDKDNVDQVQIVLRSWQGPGRQATLYAGSLPALQSKLINK